MYLKIFKAIKMKESKNYLELEFVDNRFMHFQQDYIALIITKNCN